MSARVRPPAELKGFWRVTRWRPRITEQAKTHGAHLEAQGVAIRFVWVGRSVALFRNGEEAVTEDTARERRRAESGSDV